MAIIYGLWALVIVGIIVRGFNTGFISAANWAGAAVVLVGFIHLITYFSIKLSGNRPTSVNQQPADNQYDNDSLSSAEQRLSEESLYATVAAEIQNNQIREGLMAKAMANADGNQDRQRALYIKYRVQSIKDEIETQESKVHTEVHKQQTHKQTDSDSFYETVAVNTDVMQHSSLGGCLLGFGQSLIWTCVVLLILVAGYSVLTT